MRKKRRQSFKPIRVRIFTKIVKSNNLPNGPKWEIRLERIQSIPCEGMNMEMPPMKPTSSKTRSPRATDSPIINLWNGTSGRISWWGENPHFQMYGQHQENRNCIRKAETILQLTLCLCLCIHFLCILEGDKLSHLSPENKNKSKTKSWMKKMCLIFMCIGELLICNVLGKTIGQIIVKKVERTNLIPRKLTRDKRITMVRTKWATMQRNLAGTSPFTAILVWFGPGLSSRLMCNYDGICCRFI